MNTNKLEAMYNIMIENDERNNNVNFVLSISKTKDNINAYSVNIKDFFALNPLIGDKAPRTSVSANSFDEAIDTLYKNFFDAAEQKLNERRVELEKQKIKFQTEELLIMNGKYNGSEAV